MEKLVRIFFLLAIASTCRASLPQDAAIMKCPGNETMSYCSNVCEPTCENRAPICTTQCDPGSRCTCNSGYVRHNGLCILASECPCCETEEFNACGATCEPTCDNPNPMICPMICYVEGACVCKPGYVRYNKKCIPFSGCPCKANAHFKECGSSCEDTCSNPMASSGPCTFECVQGCFCDEGYIKNANGDCIPRGTCTTADCGVNEVFSECDPNCGPTCKRPCENKCYCKKGFKRNSNGKCVRA